MKVLGRSHTSSSSSCSNSSSLPSLSASSSWIHVRSVLFIVASSSPAYRSYYRGHLKSPWFLRRRKHALSLQQWRSLFTPDGKLSDGGVNFFKKVRTGGVDPSIRTEVWPFLLGVFDLNSSKDERDILRTQKRKEYEDLRKQCQHLLKHLNESFKEKETGGTHSHGGCPPNSENVVSARESLSSEDRNQSVQCAEYPTSVSLDKDAGSKPFIDPIASAIDTESLGFDSSEDPRTSQTFPTTESREENDPDTLFQEDSAPSTMEVQSKFSNTEDFATWQRIIRLDAIRANGEWIAYAPAQTAVSDSKARHYAEAVGLEDYDQLEPCRILHAARLVAILEAYTLFDPEIGYCQGMSDLLSPIIAVIIEDYEAFWCFVGFMRKARHNFRLDEVGINRQLNIVSKIIKRKDSHLYRHLERLQAEDCFFVYRMVVVLFRRELTFEQTLFLWEVMWADQAAIRAGIGKSAWSRTRHRAPPTDDLLLYAIAASVLQRRKEIIEKYSSMEEIMRECNDMAGHLDVWKLLDDAHDLVATVHDKIEASF